MLVFISVLNICSGFSNWFRGGANGVGLYWRHRQVDNNSDNNIDDNIEAATPREKTSKWNIYNMSESKVSVFCLTLKHICLFPFQGWKLPYIEPVLSLYWALYPGSGLWIASHGECTPRQVHLGRSPQICTVAKMGCQNQIDLYRWLLRLIWDDI